LRGDGRSIVRRHPLAESELVTPILTTAAGHARDAAEHLGMAARLGRDLPSFLRTPVSRDDARASLRRSLEQREQRFLHLVNRIVYQIGRASCRERV